MEMAVATHGKIPTSEVEYALEKMNGVLAPYADAVLFARLRLAISPDPARVRRAHAQLTVDHNGRVLRAHIAAPTLHEAADWLTDRVERRMKRLVERPRALHRRPVQKEPHEWHHGDEPTHRLLYWDRPEDFRDVVRSISPIAGPETIDEAVDDIKLLGNKFCYFRNIETDEPNVVYQEDDVFHVIQPTPTVESIANVAANMHLDAQKPAQISLTEAIELMNIERALFVFFHDPKIDASGVVYMRADGNYGLISDAELVPEAA